MFSVKRGEKSGQLGGIDKFRWYVGLSHPDMRSKGGLRLPLRAPLSREAEERARNKK